MSNIVRVWTGRGTHVKRLFLLGIVMIFFVYIAPLAFQFYQNYEPAEKNIHTVQNVELTAEPQGSESQDAKTAAQDADTQSEPQEQTIAVSVGGEVREMALEDYVAGAVAAEIPASFPEEALKAQAIAARTYAVYKQSLGTDDTHPDAVVCDDYTHCAAFVDLDSEAQDLWGKNADEWSEKVKNAAQTTAGKIVTYNGAAIAAVFHAASAEHTEAAVSVWGSDIPYLSSVESTGDDACPKYDASVTFGAEEFRQIMLSKYPDINLTGLPKTWFTEIQSSDAGGVTSCKVGGQTLKGTEVRELFELNSTHFTISTTDTSITFHTEGYGHGVGMSQYGAKQMAEDGKTCEEILLHYYTGTKIADIAS